MIKTLPTLLLFFFLFQNIQAQNNSIRNVEFGIDMTPAIIWASGGDLPYEGLEFIYRELRPNGDLRFKFSITNDNFYGKELVLSKPLDSNSPESLEYFRATYIPKNSYIFSLGISKNQMNNILPVYYGIDANVGISRGDIDTERREIFLREERGTFLSSSANDLVIVGITPFLGIKKNITTRVSFALEFGLNINASLGSLEFRDENMELIDQGVQYLNFNFNRLINDIAVLIRI